MPDKEVVTGYCNNSNKGKDCIKYGDLVMIEYVNEFGCESKMFLCDKCQGLKEFAIKPERPDVKLKSSEKEKILLEMFYRRKVLTMKIIVDTLDWEYGEAQYILKRLLFKRIIRREGSTRAMTYHLNQVMVEINK